MRKLCSLFILSLLITPFAKAEGVMFITSKILSVSEDRVTLEVSQNENLVVSRRVLPPLEDWRPGTVVRFNLSRHDFEKGLVPVSRMRR